MHDGKKIALVRRLKNVKQRTLAKAVGVSTDTLSKHESSGIIPEEWWPHLERELGLTREEILAINTLLKGYIDE